MSIALAILGLALLIVIHEWGHFIVARLCGMRVERFSVGFGNPILKFKRGDTIYQLAPIPLGGFVQITGMNPHEEFDRDDPYVYPNRPRWMRLAVLVAGPGANYLTAVLLAVFIFIGFGVSSDTLVVSEVQPDSPAAAAGLRAEDVLLEADGKPVSASAPISKIIEASEGRPVAIRIRRGDAEQVVTVTPAQMDGAYRVGIVIGAQRVSVPLPQAVASALVLPAELSVRILGGLWDMITGRTRAELSGPVGIARQMASAAERGALDFVYFLALLSVYLGLFNLLPLPALDGGRVLFLVISSLGFKQVSARAEAAVHMVGLLLLLGVMVVVTFKDITDVFKPRAKADKAAATAPAEARPAAPAPPPGEPVPAATPGEPAPATP